MVLSLQGLELGGSVFSLFCRCPMTASSACAALLLVEETDICSSTFACPRRIVERLRAAGCAAASPETVRISRELFGSVKRAYMPVLAQHPSLPLSLDALVGPALRVTLDVVLTRCDRTPLAPLMRALPALLDGFRVARPGGFGAARLRLFVYERCAAGEASPPPLDVRDRLFEVRRRRMPAQTGTGGGRGSRGRMWGALRGHAAAASGEGGAGFTPAPLTLVLSRRGAALLDPPAAASAGAAAAGLRRSGGATELGGIEGVMRALRKRYDASPRADPWTAHDSVAASTVQAVVDALAAASADGTAAGEAAAAGEGAAGAAAAAYREVRGCGTNATVGWVVPAASLLSFRSTTAREVPPLPAQSCRETLSPPPPRLPAAPATEVRGEGGRAAAAAGGGGGDGGGKYGIDVATWPGNASRPGFCAVTNDGVEGSCARGGSGSWSTQAHHVLSFADCAARCRLCASCRFVTYSPTEDDCSWYSRCDLRRLGQAPGFHSLEVRPSGPKGALSGAASWAADAEEAYRRRFALDRAWHCRMLRGSLLQLVWAVGQLLLGATSTSGGGSGNGVGSSGTGGSGNGSARGGGEGGGGGGSASGGDGSVGPFRAVSPVPFGCVEPDFVLNNRRLLPSRREIAACGRLTSRSRRASLQSHLRSLAAGAEAERCRAGTTVQRELHLSGFSSMLGSLLKPWTIAIRLGLALQTPKAPGVLSPDRCRGRSRLDLGCFFRPLGPTCEATAAGAAAPAIGLNLAQLRRESLATHGGDAIPRPWRHLGAFWRASHLLEAFARR